MFNLTFGSRKPLSLLIFFLLLIVTACKKGEDAFTEESKPHDTHLTLDNIKSMYRSGSGAADRGNFISKRLPLEATPVWSETTLKLIDGHPIFLVNVAEPVTRPNENFRGNLGFFRNAGGDIESCLFLWQANTNFTEKFAPLLPASNFSGDMVVVSEKDSIKAVMRMTNGLVQRGAKGTCYFFDVPVTEESGVQDRDPKTGCYNWGTSAWNRFWHNVGNVISNGASIVGGFASQLWDNIVEHISEGAGGFIFTGGGFGGATPSGGGLVFDPNYTFPGSTPPEVNLTLYNQQLAVCTALQDAMNSTGEVPAGIGQGDVAFCALISTGIISRETGIMLISSLNTSLITELNNIINSYGSGENVQRIINTCINQYLLSVKLGKEVSITRLQEIIQAAVTGNLNDYEIAYLFDKPRYPADVIPFNELRNIVAAAGCQLYQDQCVDQALVNHYAQIFGWTQADKDLLLSDSKIREQVIRFINNNQLHHSSSVKEALKVHLEMLRTNPDYRSLNSITGTWPGWMLDIVGDVLVEIATAILKKNLPGVNLPQNVIHAIKDCGSGDLLGCIGNTIDVLKEFFPALRVVDLAIDTTENVVKATKVWKALEKLENLGEVVCDNLLKTIKAQSGNVMDNFQWVSTDVGAKLTGVDPFAFFDSFQKSFPTVLAIPINKLAPYEIAGFTIGNEYGTRVSIKYGGNTNPNGYTLEIKLPSGRITKIRFE